MKSIGSLRLFLVMVTLYMLAAVNPGWAASAVTLEAKVSQYFQHNFADDFAAGPYSLESGTLPPGLVMNLSGVIDNPTQVGVYTFTIRGFDLNGDEDRVTYTIRVNPLDPIVAHDAQASLGTSGNYTYIYDFWQHVNAGDMAASQIVIKSVSDSRATISPSSGFRPVYLYLPFAVRGDLVVQYVAVDVLNGVESNIATITFQVTRPEMAIRLNESSPPTSGDTGYGVSFIASSGVGPFTYSYSGNIPAGLVWEEDHNGSGTNNAESAIFTLRGTLPNNGVYPITVTITDALGQTKSISHTIDLGAVDPVTASDATFDLTYGGSLDVDLSTLVTGDVSAFDKSWIDTSYYRADLNGSVVTIHSMIDGGNPPRSFTIPYMVFGANGGSASGTLTINLVIAAPTVSDLSVSADHSGAINIDFASVITKGSFDIMDVAFESTSLNIVNTSPTTWHVQYDILDSAREEVIRFYATDNFGEQSNRATLRISIPAQKMIYVQGSALIGKVGEKLEHQVVVTGGVAPYTLTVSPALPDGLALNDGKIEGTPTAEGSQLVQVTAIDAEGTFGSGIFSITISSAEAVIEAPKAENGSLDLDFGQSGTVDLAQLISGDVDTIAIVSQPSKGSIKLESNTVTYVPNEGATGSDIFSFMASNGGGSAIANIAISIKEPVGEAPIAKNHFIRLQPLQAGDVNLTEGAVSKDTITRVHVLSSISDDIGIANLADTHLGFQPNKAFAGNAVVSYQLENKWGRSAIATATFAVAERPDPSKDAEVAALLKAQVDAAIRLADDQVDNITRRLEQIRAEAPGARSNSFDWQLGVDSKDSARYDHEGNDISAQNSLNARGTFESSNPLAVWTTGYLRLGESELGGIDMKSTAVGGTAGVDYRFSDAFVGGVAIGFGREMSEIGSNGTENEAKAISGALYGTWHNRNGAFVDGILGFSHLTMDSTRYVTSTGELAYGSRDGTTVFGSIIGGYRFETEKGLKIEPYAGFRGVVGKLNGFTERGYDWTNLAYGNTDIRSLKAVAGIRVEKQYETDDFLITPNAKVEYRHELASGTNTALGYADLGTMPYSVLTDPSETSSVVASVGVRVKPKASNLSVEASAQASMSGSGKPTMTYAVRANWEICGIGFKKTDCMTREQRVTFFKGELTKAEKKKDAKKIAEFKKLLAKAEADLREWNALSAKLTPVPDMNTQFVDTISGKGKRKR
ncbi:autotransporter domain-containing protein [Ochrobactrum sp. CGA5]|uniref:autotransporter domain-containing protein n=1 Tax=Ochrobactrum sp. CGA5 TaxID=2583453 RepID=UPI00112109F9|nr:autotransporter domain-containing protein [Ochrobactrum sp. CGA5]